METKKESLQVVSLFSGCGGLDLGFHLAKNSKYRYSIMWANDFFKAACETFSKNFKVKLYDKPEESVNEPSIYCGDISSFKFKEKLGNKKADIVIGGFPCQDFSLLRGEDNRNGINVKRGRLYMHFVRALIELQPKFFVAENVKGLVTANGGYAFKRIVNDFENLNTFGKEIEEDCGYKIDKNGIKGYHILHKKVVDFSRVGVPQKRQRLLIIGVRKDLINEEQKTSFENQLLNVHDNYSFAKFPLTTLEIFYGKPLNKLNGEYKKIFEPFIDNIKKIDSKRKTEFLQEVMNRITLNVQKDYLTFNYIKNSQDFDEAMAQHESLLNELGYIEKNVDETTFYDKSHNQFNEMQTVRDRMTFIPPGENHEFVRNTPYHVTGLMSNIYKRVHPLKPSPTIIANGGGGTWGYHYSVDRQRLTNRERARIQTFPDWFMFKGKSSEIRTQLGNAVPPFGVKPFAEELLNLFDKIKHQN